MRHRLVCSALMFLAAAFAGEPAVKAPVPEAAKIAEAEKTIKDIFKDEYAKRGVDDRKALAQKLLQQGHETKGDAVSLYVLLKEAAALAAQSGDAETAVNALDVLGLRFEVDAPVLMVESLAKIVPGSADAAKAFARNYLKVIELAVAADSYDAAVKACTAAEGIARKAQDVPLLTQLAARGKEVRALQADFGKVKAALARLKEQPDDPEANLTAGRFLCLVKGDWDRGLPLLEKCSDAKLKELAEKDRAAHPGPACLALGDSYWDLAEAQPAAGAVLQKRAVLWYRKAFSGLAGLDKTRVEKRLAAVEAREINQRLREREFTDLHIKLSASGGAGGHITPALLQDERIRTFNQGKPMKFFRRGALNLLDEFAGKMDIFKIHPFSAEKPALADFSAVTSAAAGTLVLHLHAFPECDCTVKLMVDGKEFKKLDIGKSKWHKAEVPFNKNTVILENHATGWYNEGVFITYEIK